MKIEKMAFLASGLEVPVKEVLFLSQNIIAFNPQLGEDGVIKDCHLGLTASLLIKVEGEEDYTSARQLVESGEAYELEGNTLHFSDERNSDQAQADFVKAMDPIPLMKKVLENDGPMFKDGGLNLE